MKDVTRDGRSSQDARNQSAKIMGNGDCKQNKRREQNEQADQMQRTALPGYYAPGYIQPLGILFVPSHGKAWKERKTTYPRVLIVL